MAQRIKKKHEKEIRDSVIRGIMLDVLLENPKSAAIDLRNEIFPAVLKLAKEKGYKTSERNCYSISSTLFNHRAFKNLSLLDKNKIKKMIGSKNESDERCSAGSDLEKDDQKKKGEAESETKDKVKNKVKTLEVVDKGKIMEVDEKPQEKVPEFHLAWGERFPSRKYITNECQKQINAKNAISFIDEEKSSRIDDLLVSKCGFHLEQIIELCGLAVAEIVQKNYKKSKILILAGTGVNGAYGLVAARHIHLFGFTPLIVYARESRKDQMRSLIKQCGKSRITVMNALPEDFTGFSLIIDALHGYSFKPPSPDVFKEIIKQVGVCEVPILSIDVPSGWDSSNGASGNPYTITPDSVISGKHSLTTPLIDYKRSMTTHSH